MEETYENIIDQIVEIINISSESIKNGNKDFISIGLYKIIKAYANEFKELKEIEKTYRMFGDIGADEILQINKSVIIKCKEKMRLEENKKVYEKIVAILERAQNSIKLSKINELQIKYGLFIRREDIAELRSIFSSGFLPDFMWPIVHASISTAPPDYIKIWKELHSNNQQKVTEQKKPNSSEKTPFSDWTAIFNYYIERGNIGSLDEAELIRTGINMPSEVFHKLIDELVESMAFNQIVGRKVIAAVEEAKRAEKEKKNKQYTEGIEGLSNLLIKAGDINEEVLKCLMPPAMRPEEYVHFITTLVVKKVVSPKALSILVDVIDLNQFWILVIRLSQSNILSNKDINYLSNVANVAYSHTFNPPKK